MPASPRSMAPTSSSRPIAAVLPGICANAHAACTFGSHRPFGERQVGERGGVGPCHRPLARRSPVQVEGVDVGGDHQGVGVEVAGQKGARPVLVDDRLDADEAPARRCRLGDVHGGDAAAAGADDHAAAVESHSIGRSPKIRCGQARARPGDSLPRRAGRPSPSRREPDRLVAGVDRPIGFVGRSNAGSAGSTSIMVSRVAIGFSTAAGCPAPARSGSRSCPRSGRPARPTG